MAREAVREAEPAFSSSLPRERGVQRKLGRDHVAFLRGALEGLPLASLSRHYLPLDDPRHAEELFQSLCASSEAAVRAAGRPSLRRLFRIFPEIPTPETADSPPTLEAFAARYDPDGVLGEVDLVAAYQDAHGTPEAPRVQGADDPVERDAARRRARAARLRQRQREALAWLESRIAQDPQAGDPVVAWFAPEIARRLHVGGLYTLHQLAERIDGVGRGWWRGVPGIGPATAERLQRWVVDHAETLRVRLGAHTTVPRRQLDVAGLMAAKPRVTAIVPLERLRVPAELDGTQGRFRAPPEQCFLSAANDYEAILAWLASKRPANGDTGAGQGRGARLTHTQRAYRKEAERFLLWAILERKQPLSSMTVEDCAAYRDFLADPEPRDVWCGPRSRERWSALWRPFEGPLSEASRRQALAILANLYGWLVQSRYLLGNPFAGVAPVEERSQRIQTGRSFMQKQWRQVQEAVHRLPESGRKRRLQFVLGFAYATGLRLSELVQARLADLEQVDLEDGDTGWMLHVTGKGGRRREVPLPEPVMHLLAGYLAARGLDPGMNRADPQAFLIGKVDDASERRRGQGGFAAHEGVAAATLAAELKRFFREVGRELKREDPKAAARFERASAHWLRHTHGSHAVAANVPIEVVQNNLGHASLSTTTIYVTSEKRRRYREMARFLGAK